MDFQGQCKREDEKFCEHCGCIISKESEICPKCGVRVIPIQQVFKSSCTQNASNIMNPEAKQRIVYILLGVFLGELGVHNFYAGYTNKGVIQLVISISLGWIFGLGLLITFIWSLVDIITINIDAKGIPMY